MRKVSIQELRHMKDKEGLILQGCGGDLQEWKNGVNDILTDQNILLNGTRFKNVMFFQKDGLTNLLFPFEDVEINIGKLSMWRLQTHGQFGGTWLSDYVDNKLGGFVESTEKFKPDCALIGANGNIFNLLGIAKRTLIDNGMVAESKEMCSKVYQCGSYSEALNVLGDYVNITSVDEDTGEDVENAESVVMTV